MTVTFYKNIWDIDSRQEYNIESLLDMIKNGVYQDDVLKVRREQDKEARQLLKGKVPNFTVSGKFTRREDNALVKHSGLIAIDFDNIPNLNEMATKLQGDPYTFALFRSISGNGLCCIVKIMPDKHVQSFEGLEDYYWKMLEVTIDPTCRNISRTRYISYDPDLYHNPNAQIFKDIRKVKHSERPAHYIHTDSKFERVVNAIDRDITGDYKQWRDIGFAIGGTYGAEGWPAFNRISSYGPTYREDLCKKQYDACCRQANGKISISTFYYYAKISGIDITNQRDEYVARMAYFGKKAGKNQKDIVKQLGDADSADKQTINAVFNDEQYEPPAMNSKALNIEDVKIWMRSRFDIRRNELTRSYELDNNELEMEKLNFIYLEAKNQFAKISRELFETLLFSTHTPSYNPIKDYLDSLEWDGQDRMAELAASINSDTGTPEWRQLMLTKWMLGIIKTVYNGEPNILCLVLAGKRNTGKTQFFKRLLPSPLKRYFANSQLDKGKDDDLLMTQKLIIFDDEYSGKSKQDAKHMKMMLSADSFTLREPYGRKNITLPRLATLCGTCNEIEILNDSTGNRRIIVMEAIGQFNYDLFNQVDKDQVFAQLVRMHQEGISAELSSEEIDMLDEFTAGKFGEANAEFDLIDKYFERPEDTNKAYYNFITTTEIKDWIELNSEQRLSLKRLGIELKRHGYERIAFGKKYGYYMKKKQIDDSGPISTSFQPFDRDENAPF